MYVHLVLADLCHSETIAFVLGHALYMKAIHGYAAIERAIGTRFYFATPHHAWEHGTNENTNGLIRQYLPKGQSTKPLSQHDCNRIAAKLNTRPRKRLGYHTPEECHEL